MMESRILNNFYIVILFLMMFLSNTDISLVEGKRQSRMSSASLGASASIMGHMTDCSTSSLEEQQKNNCTTTDATATNPVAATVTTRKTTKKSSSSSKSIKSLSMNRWKKKLVKKKSKKNSNALNKQKKSKKLVANDGGKKTLTSTKRSSKMTSTPTVIHLRVPSPSSIDPPSPASVDKSDSMKSSYSSSKKSKSKPIRPTRPIMIPPPPPPPEKPSIKPSDMPLTIPSKMPSPLVLSKKPSTTKPSSTPSASPSIPIQEITPSTTPSSLPSTISSSSVVNEQQDDICPVLLSIRCADMNDIACENLSINECVVNIRYTYAIYNSGSEEFTITADSSGYLQGITVPPLTIVYSNEVEMINVCPNSNSDINDIDIPIFITNAVEIIVQTGNSGIECGTYEMYQLELDIDLSNPAFNSASSTTRSSSTRNSESYNFRSQTTSSTEGTTTTITGPSRLVSTIALAGVIIALFVIINVLSRR